MIGIHILEIKKSQDEVISSICKMSFKSISFCHTLSELNLNTLRICLTSMITLLITKFYISDIIICWGINGMNISIRNIFVNRGINTFDVKDRHFGIFLMLKGTEWVTPSQICCCLWWLHGKNNYKSCEDLVISWQWLIMTSSIQASYYWGFVWMMVILTHWGLVTPFGDIDLGQHWLR